ncbi:MAG: fibronectin type III domain-containing protein, partial [Candidatus Cloacimonetes bacterium]|nr:fibronectin type III domain-containing protein [Candidatus Cloacimonadota bacterium]
MYDQDTATYLGSHTMAGGSTLVYVSGYEDYDAGNVTSLSITGLDPNTTYYYVVRAYNDYGTSGNSNETTVTTDEEPLPVELASFTATISAQNYITLTWVTQTETGMRGYYIYRDTDSNFAGAQNVSPLIPSTNSSQMQTYVFEDTEVYDTGTYYYWLQANDMDGTVGFHGPVSVFFNALGDNPTPEIPLVTELKSVYPNP